MKILQTIRVVVGVVVLMLLVACGEKDESGETVLPSVKNVHITLVRTDKNNNTGYVHVRSTVEYETDTYIYSDGQRLEFDSGTIEDGYITINSGRHQMQLCATNSEGTTCSDEVSILISENIELSSYHQYPMENRANSLSSNNKELFYGTVYGKIYSLNIETGVSDYLYDVDKRVSGLRYVDEHKFYYSSIDTGNVYLLDIREHTQQKITSLRFPDGLDLYKGNLFIVTDDESEVISVFNLQGEKVRTLHTGISDIVGITHTDKYLYILSEDGEIFQTNSTTGESNKIFVNDNLFEKGNNYQGLEGITILNNKIYVAYVNDKSIYLINLDLNNYE